MKFELSERDYAVVAAVSQLSQLSTAHIQTLIFPTVNRTVMDRSLKRLRNARLIKRVGVRALGWPGGTPPAVYKLGDKGWWYMRRQGDYPSVTAVREHTLHTADLFVALVEQDRVGTIKLMPETSVEMVIGNLRVDMYLDVVLPHVKKRRRFYVEVQEHARPDLIKQKLKNHYDAFNTSDRDSYPEVAVVARDDYIKFRINRLVPTNMRELVKVYVADEFIDRVISTKGNQE